MASHKEICEHCHKYIYPDERDTSPVMRWLNLYKLTLVSHTHSLIADTVAAEEIRQAEKRPERHRAELRAGVRRMAHG